MHSCASEAESASTRTTSKARWRTFHTSALKSSVTLATGIFSFGVVAAGDGFNRPRASVADPAMVLDVVAAGLVSVPARASFVETAIDARTLASVEPRVPPVGCVVSGILSFNVPVPVGRRDNKGSHCFFRRYPKHRPGVCLNPQVPHSTLGVLQSHDVCCPFAPQFQQMKFGATGFGSALAP